MTKKSKQRNPTNEKPVELCIPANFNTVLYDFVNDLMTAFPEYGNTMAHWHSKELPQPVLNEVFLYFTKVYPERFFDILYQNEDIFAKDSQVNVCFLPNVDFKAFYNCEGVSVNTRNAIWKYLQLVLVSILGSIQDKKHFGETMNMFDGVDEAALQEKLSETIDGISDFFKHLGVNTDTDGDCPDLMSEDATKEFFEQMGAGLGAGLGEESTEGMPDFNETFEKMKEEMPKAEDLHEHLKGLFDGKIGTLAKELAEEISSDMQDMFGEDTSNIRSTQDLLKKMIKNPKKIMDLMKTIGNKLQQKMKSGEISEQDIMKEAGEILGKMKGMGGKDSKDFTEMFKNLTKTMGGGLGKSKMNMGALNQFSKQMATKERLQQKLEQKRTEREPVIDNSVHLSAASNATDNYVFSLDNDEKQEKSFRRPLSAADIVDTLNSNTVSSASSSVTPSAIVDEDWMNDNTTGNSGEKSASKKKKKKK